MTCASTSSTSTGAEVPRRLFRSGTASLAEQCRSWFSPVALLAGALLLSACQSAVPGGPEPEEDPAASTAAASDPALVGACTTFWGDPDYADPLSRVVLDRAATAPEIGPSDPFFYAMTGDDVEAAFDGAPEGAVEAASGLAEWFRTQPEQGEELDAAAFTTAWEGVASACAPVSAAAAWALGPGEDGAKPAALACADVFDTPGTLNHFGNANVLTSNMFALVGRTPQQVPADRLEDVQATADLLAAEITAVDDDAVRAALEQVRTPFQDALDGDLWSDGLQDPLVALDTACGAAGYSTPGIGQDTDGGDAGEDEGLV